MHNFSELERLPNLVEQLTTLEELYLLAWSMLKHFPLGFERLKRLKVLWITWCQALEGFQTQWKGSYHYSSMGVLGWDIFHLVPESW
jgi:hypothetical protein